MVTKEETGKIIGVCMDVFHELGSGFLEPVYQDAAEIAFRQAGIPFVREAQCPIYFRGVKINRNYEADFVCYGEVILEFKAVKCFAPEHKAQLINYLKATRIPLGYLINFHGERLTWERIVYTSAESKPQTNADKCGARGLAAASQFGLRPHPTRPLRVGRIYACAEKKASVSEALSAKVCG